MNFLNSAFDSSTFMRTNNYVQSSLAPMSNANTPSHMNPINNSNSSYSANNNSVNVSSNVPMRQAGSFVVGMGLSGNNLSGSNSGLANMPASNNPNLISSCNNLLATAKSSISTNHHGHTSGSISSKTIEGRNLWLQHLAAVAANASSKRNYCSKTQIYCEAISRALDIHTCKVVPFFGAFLHDLRFIIESVPSVTIMCNKLVQKPIEVTFNFYHYLETFILDFLRI